MVHPGEKITSAAPTSHCLAAFDMRRFWATRYSMGSAARPCQAGIHDTHHTKERGESVLRDVTPDFQDNQRCAQGFGSRDVESRYGL